MDSVYTDDLTFKSFHELAAQLLVGSPVPCGIAGDPEL